MQFCNSEAKQAEDDVKSVTMLFRPDEHDHVITERSSQKGGQNRFLKISIEGGVKNYDNYSFGSFITNSLRKQFKRKRNMFRMNHVVKKNLKCSICISSEHLKLTKNKNICPLS